MTHTAQLTSAYDMACKCYRFRPVFSEIKPFLNKADITIGNLETTFPGMQAGYTKKIVFGTPDAFAKTLKWSGFDLLITANNHICDKGFAGLSRTLQTLDRFGLLHFGAYHSKREYKARRYMVIHKKGWRVALLSYTTHVNGCLGPQKRVNLLYWPQVRRDVILAKKQAFDAVIVTYHFGPEYIRTPSNIQRGAVKTALKAGADLVLGGHTHVLQPLEFKPVRDRNGIKKPRLVAYSLGNFVSNIRRRYTDGGMILHFSLNKPTTSSRQAPAHINDIHYTPVWVYKRREKTKEYFHILPIEKYRKGKGRWKLPAKDRRKMLRFERDTKRLLRRGMKQSKRYALPSNK